MFELLKLLFNSGIYSKEELKVFVLGKSITIPEYKKITGEEFTC